MKGTRVQAVIRELQGEKIDIIEWDDDPVALVKAALQPAQVARVQVIDSEQKIMEVVVEDKQLSLAIGKRGQNVRLAAKLVGWRIEIKSEEEKRLEVAAQLSEFRAMEGVDRETIQRLMEARVQGLDHLLQMTDEEFASIDIDADAATSLRQAAEAALPKLAVKPSEGEPASADAAEGTPEAAKPSGEPA
jgi:N utilization substance protein A